MDYISIPSLILVSFPESVLFALLGIFSVGKFNFLSDKKNIYRLLLFAAISSFSAYFIRRNVSSELESLIFSLILSILLFIFIIKFKFYESILTVLFGMVIIFMAEAIIAFLLSEFVGINLKEIRDNDFLRFLITLPIRILQIVYLYLAYRYKLVILDIESSAIRRKEYYIQLVVYIISIGTLVFLGIILVKIMLVDQNNMLSTNTSILLRLNIYLSLFVTVILTLAIRNTHEFYKNKTSLSNNEIQQNLEYISDLINQMNYSEAKDVIDSLKAHINKH